MQVAFVHDWLVTYRGGEKVLDALLTLYPEAPVYTLFYDRAAMPASIQARDVRTPAWLRPVRRGRKLLLPLLPRAIESLRLDGYDLLVSSSSCVAKGAVKRPGARHVCYLHSPMRYIWDQQDEYLAGVSHLPLAAPLIRALTPRLRRWDVASAAGVDRFVANSSFVAARAQRLYAREAAVVHPPIELGRFAPRAADRPREGYYLAAGALVSYKRFDLAIAACARLGRRLVIAGAGPMEAALRRQAGDLVRFEIAPDDVRMAALLAGADALIFPGVEDFGMIAIEAMASGVPVIAYEDGGARDFIQPGVTGAFFGESSPAALADALAAFAPEQFDPQVLCRYAAGYGRAGFLTRMRAEIRAACGGPA